MVKAFCIYFAGSLMIDKDISINDLLQQREETSCKSPPGPDEADKK